MEAYISFESEGGNFHVCLQPEVRPREARPRSARVGEIVVRLRLLGGMGVEWGEGGSGWGIEADTRKKEGGCGGYTDIK